MSHLIRWFIALFFIVIYFVFVDAFSNWMLILTTVYLLLATVTFPLTEEWASKKMLNKFPMFSTYSIPNLNIPLIYILSPVLFYLKMRKK